MKYYKPAIEDLRVGYECEINKEFIDIKEEGGGVWSGQPSGEYTWQPVSISGELGLGLAFKAFNEDKVRTPYLTSQQIESEGWKLDYSRESTVGVTYHKEGWELLFIGVSLLDDKRVVPFISIKKDLEYTGHCPSINEFRFICKLLGI